MRRVRQDETSATLGRRATLRSSRSIRCLCVVPEGTRFTYYAHPGLTSWATIVSSFGLRFVASLLFTLRLSLTANCQLLVASSLPTRQIAQFRVKLNDLGRLTLHGVVNSIDDGIRLRLPKSLLQHVAERLHVRLFLEVGPTVARQNQHKGPGVAAVGQRIPFEIDRPLCRSEEH